MAQFTTASISLNPVPGAGTALKVYRYTHKTVHLVAGGGAPSYTLEGSIDDGASWFTIDSATADKMFSTNPSATQIPMQLTDLRFTTVTAGTGTPSAAFMGHDPV